HHALNNDLRIAPVGGEDANTSLHRHTLIGTMRTYVHLEGALPAERWIEGLQQGRTFFSNGPLMECQLNGRAPAEELHLPAGGGDVTLEGEVWSALPLSQILIYYNGEVWKEIALRTDKNHARFREVGRVERSGWFAVTAEGPAAAPGDAFPQA